MATTWADSYRHRRYDFFKWRCELSVPQKIMLALVFAGVTGLVAQIRIPFEPVPITGQTFAVLMAGVLLGRWWGGISMAAYVGLGVAGVPWFQGWSGGVTYFTGPTCGYLIGFILAALFLGYFVDRYINSRKFLPMMGLMLFANFALIYIPGLIWLHSWWGSMLGPINFFSYTFLWAGLIVFIGGDMVKLAAAAALTKAIAPKEAYNNEVDAGKVWRRIP